MGYPRLRFFTLGMAVLLSAPAAAGAPREKCCPPPLAADLAAQELAEANTLIKRAGEHPLREDLAQILPRLRRAAHAGNQAARIRFGTYVVGYSYTDMMFWPREPDIAVPALAMLILAARAESDPQDALLRALAKDRIVFTDADGPPALPRRWIKAALKEAKRLARCAEPVSR